MRRAVHVPRVWIDAAERHGNAARREGRHWATVDDSLRRRPRRYAGELAAAWLRGWQAADRELSGA